MRTMPQRPKRSNPGAGNRRFVLYQYVPFLMSRATAILAREMHRRVGQHGLEVIEWRILVAAQSQGDVSVRELADYVMEPQPTVSRWLDRMQGKGLLERVSSEDDGRVSIVKLSESGRQKAVEISRIALAHESEALGALSADEQLSLRHYLERVVMDLESNLVQAPLQELTAS